MEAAVAKNKNNNLTLKIFEEYLHKDIDKPTVNFRMRTVGPSRQDQ